MAKPESRYTVKIGFEVNEEGKDEPPMTANELCWNGLTYAAVVAFETILVQVLGKTTEWGVGVVEKLGQKEELDALLGNSPRPPKK